MEIKKLTREQVEFILYIYHKVKLINDPNSNHGSDRELWAKDFERAKSLGFQGVGVVASNNTLTDTVSLHFTSGSSMLVDIHEITELYAPMVE